MATHVVTLQKIEYSEGAVEVPAWWENKTCVTERGIASGGGWVDITSDYWWEAVTPGVTYTEGVGWQKTGVSPDNLAISFNFLLEPAAYPPGHPNEYELPLDFELGYGTSGAPLKFRITLDVTAALDGGFEDPFPYTVSVSHEDAWNGNIITPEGDPMGSSYKGIMEVSAGDTAADIQTYVFPFDIYENPANPGAQTFYKIDLDINVPV